jgi:hypothetical protein
VFAACGEGFPQVNVVLPDGRRVGRLTIKESEPKATLTGPGVLDAWCRDHYPDGLEEYVDPNAWTSLDVIEAVKARVPGVVKTRIRAAAAESLTAEALASGGWLLDKSTGDKEKVADVTEGRISGEFAFTDQKSPERRAAIIGAWQAGVIDLAPMLALPPAGGGDGADEHADAA